MQWKKVRLGSLNALVSPLHRQGTNGKGMPQIDEPRASTTGGMENPSGREHLVKRLRDHSPREWAVPTRDKEIRVHPGDTATLKEILVERRPRRRMQRQQAAFLELGVPDEQAVDRHIRELQGQGFRHPHTSDREQAKQRAVGLGS